MWWGLLAFILALSAVVMYYRGPVAALGTGVLVTFLFPCWIVEPFAGVPIELRTATALILLVAQLFDPRRKIVWSFAGADWAIFVLYFVHVGSDSWHDGFMFAHVIRAFGEWSIPYIAGRLAVQNVQDWRWLTKVAVIVAMIHASMATVEAMSHRNPNTPVFGARPADRARQVIIRSGYKRAEGPTRHAIWFGMVQMLLLPWTIEAANRGLKGDGPMWWFGTPIFNLIGIIATVSRGPFLGALSIYYLTAVFNFPKIRQSLIIGGIVLAIAGLIGKNYLLRSLEVIETGKLVTEAKDIKNAEFDGEQVRVTSMSHRWLVFSAYRQAIRETGLLGFGSSRTSKFPVNVPFGPDAKQTVSKFWSIDCEYLLILLRFGWVGLAAFAAVCVMSAWHLAKQTELVTPQERILPWAITATIISTSFALIIEWMPTDYGFLFLWLCGAASGPRLQPVEVPVVTTHRRRSSKRESPKSDDQPKMEVRY